jgi:hypothetical protein
MKSFRTKSSIFFIAPISRGKWIFSIDFIDSVTYAIPEAPSVAALPKTRAKTINRQFGYRGTQQQ